MTCRTCTCADKAADTDEWVTFAKRPVAATSEAGLPRPIRPAYFRPGDMVEYRTIYRVDNDGGISAELSSSWWLLERPEPVDPDAEAVNAIRDASYAIHVDGRRIDPLPGLSEARMLLDALREAGYSVTRDRDAQEAGR